jgi:CubicO group peptidase (beta-lactamase class C family)
MHRSALALCVQQCDAGLMTLLSTIYLIAMAAALEGGEDHPAWAERCAQARAYSAERRGTTLLVVAEGKPVCAAHQDNTPQELWSGTKSIITLLAAMAVDDGLLALDEPASDTISEWRSDPAKAGITIRQLLKMTSGIPSQVGMPPGFAESLAVVPSHSVGERFLYGPAPYQVFGELLRRKLSVGSTPETIRSYANRRLFVPLEITDLVWRNGRDGNPLMPQGISLTAHDWAKIGALVEGGGCVGGKCYLSSETLNELFKGSAANPAYGVGWWLPRSTSSGDAITATFDLAENSAAVPTDLVASAGAGGQRLYVIPSRNLVIVRQASLDVTSLRSGRAASEDERKRWSDAAFLALLLGEDSRSN